MSMEIAKNSASGTGVLRLDSTELAAEGKILAKLVDESIENNNKLGVIADKISAATEGEMEKKFRDKVQQTQQAYRENNAMLSKLKKALQQNVSGFEQQEETNKSYFQSLASESPSAKMNAPERSALLTPSTAASGPAHPATDSGYLRPRTSAPEPEQQTDPQDEVTRQGLEAPLGRKAPDPDLDIGSKALPQAATGGKSATENAAQIALAVTENATRIALAVTDGATQIALATAQASVAADPSDAPALAVADDYPSPGIDPSTPAPPGNKAPPPLAPDSPLFGYPGGSYLAPNGTPFTELSLPPQSSPEPCFRYLVNDSTSLPSGWQIEQSQAPGWSNQTGDGTQFRIIDEAGNNGSVDELVKCGYLRRVD